MEFCECTFVIYTKLNQSPYLERLLRKHKSLYCMYFSQSLNAKYEELPKIVCNLFPNNKQKKCLSSLAVPVFSIVVQFFSRPLNAFDQCLCIEVTHAVLISIPKFEYKAVFKRKYLYRW